MLAPSLLKLSRILLLVVAGVTGTGLNRLAPPVLTLTVGFLAVVSGSLDGAGTGAAEGGGEGGTPRPSKV